MEQGMQLKFYPLVIKDGVKLVKLNLNEVEQQCQQWKNALIGSVIGGNPTFKEMLKPLILKEWNPDFSIKNDSIRVVPIWVMFPGLPVQLWAKENLGRLACYIGKPLCTDTLTAHVDRISYARVLIEVDITQPLPDVLLVIVAEGKIWEQNVEYEWKPTFCQDCNQFGHMTEKCQQKQPEQEQQGKKQNKRKKKEKWEWKTKAVELKDKVEVATTKTTKDPETNKPEESPAANSEVTPPEIQIQLQLSNKGKQVVVYHGSKKKDGKHIDAQEIARRNQFAPLRILEKVIAEPDGIEDQLVDKGTKTSKPPPP
ncbi:PREDICTED: uncharacterized protein LOC109219599 [Nicotiana attenuata]|uniref:uncharacterized protein LOC109219599 n=1 Tax=Nicotiana attenuata TaxID=49451 RepID=UPI000904B6C6|nr:PREDICTED: uncharacterized protein LOC109219599 [Nicotiana attenuata]